jgi:hypothetical protein
MAAPELRISQKADKTVRMTALGLGRVKTFWRRRSELAEGSDAGEFCDFGYARIAAISGWMPMMFMTRVRL